MKNSLRTGLVMAIAIFAWAGFLLTIPPRYSSLLLLLMLAGGAIYYDRKHGLTLRPLLDTLARIHIAPRTAAIISLAAMILSAFLLDPTVSGRPAFLALPLVVIGGAALWIALNDQPVPQLAIARSAPASIRYYWLALGCLMLLFVAEINGRALRIPSLYDVSSHIQFALFVGGIVLVIRGLAGRLPAITQFRFSTPAHVMLLAITALALLLRVWHVGAAIPVFVDEANFTNIVMRFWDEGDTGIFMRSDGLYFHFPHLFPYGQWWTVGLFGRTLAGLRIFSAMIGTLTIPAVYLLGRSLFNVRVGLLAALLLATFPPHLQFSRLGMNNIADPLFGTLALAFLARALKSGQRLDYVLGGVALGLTQYFYEGGHLLYPVLTVFWIASIALVRRVCWREIGFFVLAAVIVSLPLYYAWLAGGLLLLPRVHYIFDFKLPILPRIARAFLSYVRLPEAPVSVYYYGGHTAMILPLLVPFFLFGVVFTLRGIVRRAPGIWLLPSWLILVALGVSPLIVPNMYARYVVVFPALAILLALGMCDVLPGLLTGRLHRQAAPVVGIVVAVVVAIQVFYYFGPHLAGFTTQFWEFLPKRNIDDALLRATDFADPVQVYVISSGPPDWGITSQKMHFLGVKWELTLLRRGQPTADYLPYFSHDVDQAFFIDAGDEETLALLSQSFDLEAPEYTGSVPDHERYDLYYYHAPEDN